jgi:hypothetical protein
MSVFDGLIVFIIVLVISVAAIPTGFFRVVGPSILIGYLNLIIVVSFAIVATQLNVSENIIGIVIATYCVVLPVSFIVLAPGKRNVAEERNSSNNKWPDPAENYFLYLRPFRLASKLATQSTSTIGRPISAGFQHPTHIDFETLLAGALPAGIRLIGLGGEAENVPPSGAQRLYINSTEWWEKFEQLANTAEAIFLIPDSSENVLREISWLQGNGLLDKCIFIMPETVPYEHSFAEEWGLAAEELRKAGISLPTYHENGALFMLGSAWDVSFWGVVRSAPLGLHRRWRRTIRVRTILAHFDLLGSPPIEEARYQSGSRVQSGQGSVPSIAMASPWSPAAPQSPAPARPVTLSKLRVGDRVLHKSLGEGVLDSVEDDSTGDVKVAFPGRPKPYSMNTAYLTRVDR